MEDIFKSLSESVSEQCYDEVMGIVEEIVNETSDRLKEAALKKARENVEQAKKSHNNATEKYRKTRYSKDGDRVLDAIALLKRREKKEEKLKKAIDRHDKAKAEGRIVSREESKDDGDK